MMLTTLIGATLIALAPTTTPTIGVRAPEVIEIRSGMFNDSNTTRRDQVRYSNTTQGVVVAEMDQSGDVQWDATSDREKLGGQDGPAMIYVRVFDAVFSIDPFVPLSMNNRDAATASRTLFLGASLETNRTLFDRQRIERTEELFTHLETARVNWLRDNGYYSPQTVTRAATTTTAASTNSIEPIMKIERPADMPRGRTFEQVDATPACEDITAVSASILDTDAPVRISVPFGTASDVVAEAAYVTEDSQTEEETSEIASK